jgi:hypothetical protein
VGSRDLDETICGLSIDKTWVLLVYHHFVGLRLSVVGSVATVGFAHHKHLDKVHLLLPFASTEAGISELS